LSIFVISYVTARPEEAAAVRALAEHPSNGNAEWLSNRYAAAIAGKSGDHSMLLMSAKRVRDGKTRRAGGASLIPGIAAAED
jgi:hypothetical protein